MDIKGTLIIKQLKAYISRDLSHLGKLKIGSEKQTTQPTKKPGQNPEWQVSHKFLVKGVQTCEIEITNSQDVMGQSTSICTGSFQIKEVLEKSDIKCELSYKGQSCGSLLIIADWIEYGRVAVGFTKMGLKAMAETIFDVEAQATGGQMSIERLGVTLAQVFQKLGENPPPSEFIPIALQKKKLNQSGKINKKEFRKIAKEICGFSKAAQLTGRMGYSTVTTTTTTAISGNYLTLKVLEGKFLHDLDSFGKMDPFIVMEYGDQKQKTSVKQGAGKTPKWNQEFSFSVAPGHDHIYFTAYDEDVGKKNDIIGEGDITLSTYNGKGKTPITVQFSYKGKNQGTVTMEVNYLLRSTEMFTSVQYQPSTYEQKQVYQSYVVSSNHHEVEKMAVSHQYVSDIKDIKKVEFRGELNIMLSESSTITVHTQTIEQHKYAITQLQQQKQQILSEKYAIESELQKVKDSLLEREVLYKANYEKLRLAFESLQIELSIKIKQAGEKYHMKFKKYKNEWKVMNYSKGQRESELLAIIESLNVKIRGLEGDLVQRSSAYSEHITLISTLRKQIEEMELKNKSSYDSIIYEWQMKLNQVTDKYKGKFKKYKSYYKQILVQKSEWEKDRNSAISSYQLQITELEKKLSQQQESLSQYLSMKSKFEVEINEYKYKLSEWDKRLQYEMSRKDEEMRVHIENLRIERERYQILLSERDSNLSIIMQMKKDIERWQIEIYELKKVIEAKQDEIDRLEADQAMRDDELIRLKKEFARIFEIKDIEIKQKKFEIMQYIEDIQLLEAQKMQFIDLISDVYFKKYDRTKKQTLDKGEYDRAVCELFESLGEASPPFELSLKFMQKHDSGSGNLQFQGFKLSMRDLFNFILEQKRNQSREYLKWNFVSQVSKKDLKQLGKQIFAKADRTKSEQLDEKEFDYAICQLFEQLNTRAPDVKLTRRILEKYGYANRKIKEKEFIKVLKDLCGFSQGQLEVVSAEEIFTKQRKITEMKKKDFYKK